MQFLFIFDPHTRSTYCEIRTRFNLIILNQHTNTKSKVRNMCHLLFTLYHVKYFFPQGYHFAYSRTVASYMF